MKKLSVVETKINLKNHLNTASSLRFGQLIEDGE